MNERRKKLARRDALLGVLILLTIAGKLYFGGPYHTPVITRWQLGDDTIRIIENAELVETYRILPLIRQSDGKPVKRYFGQYPMVEKGRLLSSTTTRDIGVAILASASTSAREVHTGFQPGIGFRLWKGGKSVDVAVCLKCDNLSIERYETGEKGGKPARSLLRGCDNQREILLKAAHEGFPGTDFK